MLNFQIKDVVPSSRGNLQIGAVLKCNAWLLDENAKIPYLVSSLWTEGDSIDSHVRDKILGMPQREAMEVM